MILTALGIDIMLPAFAALRGHFGLPADSAATANIVMFFFMGQMTQLLFGLFSDRFGRLPTLRIGFPLYIIGGVASAFAPTMPMMYVARFIGGVGASAVFSTTMAVVRDRYAGDEMARVMSLIFTVFLFTPVVAPFLGSAILQIASWQWVFLTPPLFAVIVFLWSFRLPESLPVSARTALQWGTVGQSIKVIMTNTTFLRYTAITTLLFGSFSTYISSSERIIGEFYSKPQLFSWIFGGIGLLMASATFVNARLASRFGARRTLQLLLIFYNVVAALLCVITLVSGNKPHLGVLVGGMAVLASLNLAISPNSSAMAMEPLGNQAGLASAMYGTVYFLFGSLIGTVINGMLTDHILPFVAGFLFSGLGSLVLAGIILPKK